MIHSAGSTDDNPYEPPAEVVEAENTATTPSRWSLTLIYMLKLGAVAGAAAFVGAVAEYRIYADDPRTGTSAGPPLIVPVLGGAVLCGLLWSIAAVIAKVKLEPLLVALTVSILMVAIWIAFSGVYADVLGAATVVGWPLGGIGGAVIGRLAVESRDRRSD